ncbi:conjugative transfer signal peptidase TraF [Desulfovibrio sp. DV]|uniref:conjugative transfer signal peptidase TraF n=1 Tax=Desulfovibrio sp. DV TaxID=1844708 RepID=UPI00094B7D86|nr:conjugative transfer signal peptidase TraF [Desulfovibrio sp. DV]
MRPVVFLVCFMGCAGALLFESGFRFNATASMPRGFYQFVPGQAAVIEHGALVSFCMEDVSFTPLALERGYLRPGSCPGGLQPLLKVVAGLPGDEVGLAPDGIRINGQLQPESQAHSQDSHGRPLPPMALRPGRIPPGMALILSSGHPGGFDGRYFGLVHLASLRKVKPFFILH